MAKIFLTLLVFSTLLLPNAIFGQWTQDGQKFVGSTGVKDQGRSVALSGDGTTALIGAKNCVLAFIRQGSVWVQQGDSLVGTDAVGNADQGYSVALSEDGNTALVGGPDDSRQPNTNTNGAVWVFVRNGSSWSQEAKLYGLVPPTDYLGCRQGVAVSLSGDGNTALVGAPNDFEGGITGSGAGWVFSRTNGTWDAGVKFKGTGNIGSSNAGISVCISGDGYTAIIGGNQDDNSKGAAWIFLKDGGGNWVQEGRKLVGTGSVGRSRQGVSVAMNWAGDVAMVGGDGDNNYKGAVWVYEKDGSGSWVQKGSKLVATGAVGDVSLGGKVSINGLGNRALIAGLGDNNLAGAAWGFSKDFQGNWGQDGGKLVGSGNVGQAWQGSGVAINRAGDGGLVSGLRDNLSQGAVWAWKRDGTVGIDESAVFAGIEAGLKVYPNPTKDLFNVSLDNQPIENAEINIYNTLGELIETTSKSIIDVSQFKNGVYFLRIKTATLQINTHFIVIK